VGLFDKVERGLERAVNSAFARAFKSEVQPVELASAIRRAMDDRAAVMGHGRTIVPNLYTVELSGTDFERLSGYEETLSDELVAAAQEHADSQRYQPGGPVQVTFQRDEELETGVFRVRPATSRRSIAPTTQAPERSAAPPAPNAASSASSATSATSQTAAPPQRPTHSPVQRPWLVVDGERYPLIGAHTVIGRDELADIVLDDPGISRRHCEVRVTNDGPRLVTSIRDLGSTNGTFVNGQRITSTRLDEGDQVTIGRTQAVFRPGKR